MGVAAFPFVARSSCRKAALTVAVLWLLQIPGLMLGGGVLLVWIAWRLLAGNEASRQHDIAPAQTPQRKRAAQRGAALDDLRNFGS